MRESLTEIFFLTSLGAATLLLMVSSMLLVSLLSPSLILTRLFLTHTLSSSDAVLTQVGASSASSL